MRDIRGPSDPPWFHHSARCVLAAASFSTHVRNNSVIFHRSPDFLLPGGKLREQMERCPPSPSLCLACFRISRWNTSRWSLSSPVQSSLHLEDSLHFRALNSCLVIPSGNFSHLRLRFFQSTPWPINSTLGCAFVRDSFRISLDACSHVRIHVPLAFSGWRLRFRGISWLPFCPFWRLIIFCVKD